MIARQRYGKGRQASIKSRVGIATAVLVGGGSIAAVAVAATSHGTASQGATAQPAAYAARYGNEWNHAQHGDERMGPVHPGAPTRSSPA